MKFGKLELDPAHNPAVLDTATWDVASAWGRLRALSDDDLAPLALAAADSGKLPGLPGCTLYEASCVRRDGALVCLSLLEDGQHLFLQVGPEGSQNLLGEPMGVRTFGNGWRLAAYAADSATADRFCFALNPGRGPRPLGAQPALGIGTRMTISVWPGIWRAMAEGGFAANAIQNSVRELNLLDDLLAARPAPRNMAFNFGWIESGYTGSTYEGLWLSGVLDALKADRAPWFGADADHIQVKRGAEGLARAMQVASAARYYTFYTLDVSDVLVYGALSGTAAPTGLPEGAQRADLLGYHRAARIGGLDYRPDEDTLLRLAAKYAAAFDAVYALVEHINGLKQGRSYDLELSIDEHPPEVASYDCLTSPVELAFVVLEARRRGLPITHVAPNLGVEKGVDYSLPDGLAGLEPRAAALTRICADAGVMLDVHSGDDLSAATRQTLRRATGGRCHFKVSPMLQLIYAEVLADYYPDLFRAWWQDALAYARREAANGSKTAVECVASANEAAPSVHDAVFHHYSFAFVGRRDAEGRFLTRDVFYALSDDFNAAYAGRIAQYLRGLAEDVLG